MKNRLDEILVLKGLAPSKEEASKLIMAGMVRVNGERLDKPGVRLKDSVDITVLPLDRTVGRGSAKLRGALLEFNVFPRDCICGDIGACTGGFTQVLLEEGAKKVYAIDSAQGVLAWEIRSHPKVITLEKTNILSLQELPELLDFVSIDVSLLSLKKVLPHILPLLEEEATIITLVKPQYEIAPAELPPGGVITHQEMHHSVLSKLLRWLEEQPFSVEGLTTSSILGMGGNKEFFFFLKKQSKRSKSYSETKTQELLVRLFTPS